MMRSRRNLLLLTGVLIVLCACSALAYALVPTDNAREQFRPAPTLFVPPP